jgi:hypothetical protein
MTSNLNDLNNFNDLINNVNNVLLSSPAVVEQQTSQDLKQKYLDAQTNIVKAPAELFDATKNYITFTQGTAGYEEYLDKELNKQAEKKISNYQDNFKREKDKIKLSINNLQSICINYTNINDLYEKYKKENILLESNLKKNSADIITNERKSYYENEGISSQQNAYYVLIFIYFIIVLIFLLAIIFVNSSVKLYKRILIFFSLIIYPFVIIFIFEFLKNSINRIKDYLPSTAYRNI